MVSMQPGGNIYSLSGLVCGRIRAAGDLRCEAGTPCFLGVFNQ